MDKFTLVIGNKNYSSWSLRPWVLMKYFGIPFEEVQIPLAQPDSKEKILKHSPAGKVPILKHGKILVWESIAICDYLADLFPNKNLWPKDDAKRAVARSIAAEMHAGFIHLRKACPMNIRERKKPLKESTELDRDVKRVKEIWENCRGKYQKDGDFLLGEFSIADAMYAPVVYRFQTYGLPDSGASQRYIQTMVNVLVMKEWSDAGAKEKWVIEHH